MQWIKLFCIFSVVFLVIGCPTDSPDHKERIAKLPKAEPKSLVIEGRYSNWILYTKKTNFAEANDFCNGIDDHALSATPAVEADLSSIQQQSGEIGLETPVHRMWSASDSDGKLIVSSNFEGTVKTILLQRTVKIVETPSENAVGWPLCVELGGPSD